MIQCTLLIAIVLNKVSNHRDSGSITISSGSWRHMIRTIGRLDSIPDLALSSMQ